MCLSVQSREKQNAPRTLHGHEQDAEAADEEEPDVHIGGYRTSDPLLYTRAWQEIALAAEEKPEQISISSQKFS